MVRHARGRRGYSLAELMIVVAIVGILGSLGARLMLQVNRYFVLTSTRTSLQSEARSLMYVVSRNLRQARSTTIVVDRAPGQPPCTRLTLTKVQGPTISFYQRGTDLVQAVGAKQRVLSRNVKYLAFTFPRSDDLSIVSVAVTLEKGIYEGRTKALHMASEKVRVMN